MAGCSVCYHVAHEDVPDEVLCLTSLISRIACMGDELEVSLWHYGTRGRIG